MYIYTYSYIYIYIYIYTHTKHACTQARRVPTNRNTDGPYLSGRKANTAGGYVTSVRIVGGTS